MSSTHMPNSALLGLLLHAGFPALDARSWAKLGTAGAHAATLAIALAWQDEGIPTDDAVRWHQAGWCPEETTLWWLLGFTPAQATFVAERLSTVASSPGHAHRQSHIHDWLTSGLSPDDIVLCIATGSLTLDEAREVVSAIADDSSLRGTLRLRASMRGIHLDELGRRRP